MAESRAGDVGRRSLEVTRLAKLVLLLAVPSGVVAQSQDSAVTTLKPVVVTVTRGSGRTILGSPFAISISEPDSSRPGQRHIAVDETLALIPGLTAVNRSNPSQDPRLSIRGFGARSAFGVRGIRVLRDGMPLTLPDGQTPLDYLSLESVGAVEVLRGAASALYGNASGGVIDLRSIDPPANLLSLEAKQWLGEGALSRTTLAASGNSGAFDYVGDAAYTRGEGSRAHSTQRAATSFARVRARRGAMEYALTEMTLVSPLAENPGALTLEEMKSDPEMADALSVRRNAKKAVNQIQLGATIGRAIHEGEVSLSAYGGARSLDNPLTFAVVEVGRHTWGASGAVRARRDLFGVPHSLAIGFDVQLQNDLRKNYAGCRDTVPATAPSPTCPFPGRDRGIITLDQRELVSGSGAYATDAVSLGERVSVTGALRVDRVRFEVKDRLVGSNPDDSGDRVLSAVSPGGGIIARVGPTHAIYANLSTAFETPTATELGNHADGSAGINPDLDPQRSLTAESGIKGWFANTLRYDIAVFATRVKDELIPFEIPASNGRRYFRNAGRTSRRGAELGGEMNLDPVTLMIAYTWSRFRFEDYVAAGVDLGGKTIPGISPNRLQSLVRVHRRGAFMLIENELAGRAWLDDANTVRASSYSVTGVRLGWRPERLKSHFSITTGLQNIFDRVYASSLVVNAARGKYYEPAPRRSAYVGISIGSHLSR